MGSLFTKSAAIIFFSLSAVAQAQEPTEAKPKEEGNFVTLPFSEAAKVLLDDSDAASSQVMKDIQKSQSAGEASPAMMIIRSEDIQSPRNLQDFSSNGKAGVDFTSSKNINILPEDAYDETEPERTAAIQMYFSYVDSLASRAPGHEVDLLSRELDVSDKESKKLINLASKTIKKANNILTKTNTSMCNQYFKEVDIGDNDKAISNAKSSQLKQASKIENLYLKAEKKLFKRFTKSVYNKIFDKINSLNVVTYAVNEEYLENSSFDEKRFFDGLCLRFKNNF